jgi:hypothetical protein
MSAAHNRLKEIEAQVKELAAEKEKLLAESKKEDLEIVKQLCERHGFTAADLKDAVKMHGRGRPPAAVKPKRDPNAPKRKYTRRAKSAA